MTKRNTNGSEKKMNGQNIVAEQTSPTPEVTDEQRAAVERVMQAQSKGCGEVTHPNWSDVNTILEMLPSTLTNPQPVLPTEPGARIRAVGHDGDEGYLILAEGGVWMGLTDNYAGEVLEADPIEWLKSWSLVVEREPITMDQVLATVNAVATGPIFAHSDVTNHQLSVLAQSIFALVKRADQ